MRRRRRARFIALSAAALLAGVPCAWTRASMQVTENFNTNTDAYWAQQDNRTAPQNYGWSNTNNTGSTVKPPGPDGIPGNADDGIATGAGELGGLIYRPMIPAAPSLDPPPDTSYGFDVGTINPATEGFNVSGVLRSNRKDGAVFLGYFQGAFSLPDRNKNAHNFVGILLNDGGSEVYTQVYNPNGSREGGLLATPVPTNGTPVPFSMQYQPPPAGMGNGSLTVTVGNATGTTNLPNNIVQSIGDLTQFGLFPQVQDAGPTQAFSELYFDDLTFSSENPIPLPTGSVWALDGDGDWFTAGNWTGGVPNGVDASATFSSAITANHVVFANSPATVGTLIFNNASHSYLIDGTGSLTLQTSTGNALIDGQGGSHEINLPLTFASNTTVQTVAGTTLTIADPVTVNSGVNVTQAGAGTVLYTSTVNVLSGGSITFGNTNHLAGLTVAATGTATLAPGNNKVLRADSLSVSGRLDLKDNKLITPAAVGSATAGTYNGVSGLIQSGRNGGNWSGNGIVTSQTAATTGSLTSIGVASAAQVKSIAAGGTSVWNGQTVTGSDTLVMYTYGGDANLDGKINVDDYGRIDSSVPLGIAGWYNGDFNYDGKINVDDYGIIDSNIGIQGAPLGSTSGLSSSVAAVPEPASAAVFVLAVSAAVLRRRRRETT